MRLHPRSRAVGATLALWFVLPASQATAKPSATIDGDLKQWHPITLSFAGPGTNESATPNPFTDYRLDVTFRQGKQRLVVPGYFAADGDAADSSADAGDTWRVHFTPPRTGIWQYRVSFVGGTNVATRRGGKSIKPLHGTRGTLKIEASDKTTPDLRAHGNLRHVGKRYLQFAGSQQFFVKNGADSPENLLGYVDFDNTYQHKGVTNKDEGHQAMRPLHRYAPHVDDWQSGDPTWGDGKGKGLIGGLNYLASKGVNSVYFLTMNVVGDGRDTWPWTTHQERRRFDVSKLAQWERVFTHMDHKGLAMHVVLTETENEALFELDAKNETQKKTSFADTRKLYYREMVARFGHHPAIVWNIGEENGWDDRKKVSTSEAGIGNTDRQRKQFASHLHALDPYDHPVVVHTLPNDYDRIYTPLVGHRAYQGASLQMGSSAATHLETLTWVERSEKAGQPWFVCLDEIGPAGDGVKPDSVDPDHDHVRHTALWGNLMAGGSGAEWYFGYKFPHNDVTAEDWRSRDRMWDQGRHAIEFFQRHLPFTRMRNLNHLTPDGDDYVFAQTGDVYAVYLPPLKNQDERTTKLHLPQTDFTVAWFDPRSGGALQQGSVARITGAGFTEIGLPPAEAHRDWVALIKRDGPKAKRIELPKPPAPPRIAGFTLIDADKDAAIRPLKSGDRIRLSQLDAKALNIAVEVKGKGGVQFKLNGSERPMRQSEAPFAVGGDDNGDFHDMKLKPGRHQILATPMEGHRLGKPVKLTFTVVQ